MPAMRDFMSMIDYAVNEAIGNLRFCFPKYSQFEKRLRDGVVLYNKPSKNNNCIQYKKTNFDRRIASKRVFTHTKK